MNTVKRETNAPFLKIGAASKATGLSQYFCGAAVAMVAFLM